MSPNPSAMKAGLNGAVAGAAAAALLGLVLALTALFTGGHVALPGLITAPGGTTNSAASVEFNLGWTVLAAAALVGAGVAVTRAHGRRRGAPTARSR